MSRFLSLTLLLIVAASGVNCSPNGGATVTHSAEYLTPLPTMGMAAKPTINPFPTSVVRLAMSTTPAGEVEDRPTFDVVISLVDAETGIPIVGNIIRWQEYKPTGETANRQPLPHCQEVTHCLITLPADSPDFLYWIEAQSNGYMPETKGIRLSSKSSRSLDAVLELERVFDS